MPPDKADGSSLAGRRIVVTRAPEQSQELFDRLRSAGAKTLSLPMVRFLDPVDTSALDVTPSRRSANSIGWC